MGMSASQARLLSLQARQSNLEYQGQQINQERTILSQQCTALYNSLLAMTVPTPPSTSDYTTIEYSGTDGATTFTLGTVKPSGENYNVELQQSATGSSLSKNYGSSVVTKGGEKMTGTYESPTITETKDTYSQLQDGTAYSAGDIYINETPITGDKLLSDSSADPKDYMELNANGEYVAVKSFKTGGNYYKKSSKDEYDNATDKTQYSHLRQDSEDVNRTLSSTDLSKYYVTINGSVSQLSATSPYVKLNSDGTYTLKSLPEGAKLFKEGSGDATLDNPNAGKTLIAGKTTYTFEEASKLYTNFDWEKYKEAIKNCYGSQDESIDENDFYVYKVISDTGVESIQFALKTDVDSPDGFTETFAFNPNGKYTTSTQMDGCKLQFDTQGRITKISIPSYDEATGDLIGYRDITLTAKKVTDEAAYQDAYNEYEYAQYEYDKKQQEINAATEIIQQEDRNLELKLQRLDNERTQITTEIEAVEKVINDNIEGSYKTFSG